MYIKTANFLSKISLKKKKKKKQKSTTIACEDQRALKDMLQNVQKLGHIPETWFVILIKKKKKTLFGSICEDPPLFFFSNGLMFE
jgi:hypothetical protein